MAAPPFSLEHTRYDQSTVMGRLKHFYAFTSPFTIFTSEAELGRMKRRLDDFRKGQRDPSVTDATLWHDRNVIEVTYARDGTKIPIPFRMNGYGLFNLPVTVGLMAGGSGIATIAFWQWVNQHQNAFTNHYNRSSVKPQPMEKTAQSYATAVTAALSTSIGATVMINRIENEATRIAARRVVPFFSVATANILNTWLMRREEMKNGIEVTDNEGNVVGTSIVAAKRAVHLTCASRAMMSFCMLAIPPQIFPILERTATIKANPRLVLPMQIGVVASFIFIIIPASLSLFDESASMSADALEAEFKERFPGQVLRFNKGL